MTFFKGKYHILSCILHEETLRRRNQGDAGKVHIQGVKWSCQELDIIQKGKTEWTEAHWEYLKCYQVEDKIRNFPPYIKLNSITQGSKRT